MAEVSMWELLSGLLTGKLGACPQSYTGSLEVYLHNSEVTPYRLPGQGAIRFMPRVVSKPWVSHIGDTDVHGRSQHRLGGKRTRAHQAASLVLSLSYIA